MQLIEKLKGVTIFDKDTFDKDVDFLFRQDVEIRFWDGVSVQIIRTDRDAIKALAATLLKLCDDGKNELV